MPPIIRSATTPSTARSNAWRCAAHLVNFGQSSGPIPPFAITRLAAKSNSLTRPMVFHYIAERPALEAMAAALFAALASGALRAEPGQALPLAEARAGTPASRIAAGRGAPHPAAAGRHRMNVVTTEARIGDSRIAERLRRETEGEVLWTAADRGRYATDASIYQIEPIGVLVPRSIADVEAAMALCREEGIPVLPRGGGTSQCGQTVNRALVIDCTKYLRRRRSTVDAAARTATVAARHRAGRAERCAEAARAVLPGRSLDLGALHHRRHGGEQFLRQQVDPLRADGGQRAGHRRDAGRWQRASSSASCRTTSAAMCRAGIAELIQRLRALGAREAEEIAARFPEQLRRVGGYNLDALTPAGRAAGRGNLARLLVGSEGTLAFSAALDLKLWPIKPRKALGICQFPTFRAAMAASQHLVTLDPEAVELVDRTMIDLGRSIPIYRATIDQHRHGRAGQPADRRIPRRGGRPARAPARCAGRDDGRSRLSRRRGPLHRSRLPGARWPRCARPGSTS